MSNSFKITPVSLTTTGETALITATDSSVFIVSSIIIANVTSDTDSTVTLILTDASQAADFNLLTTEPILRTLSKEVLSRPLVLENLDSLKIQAANANVYHVFVSYLDRDRK